MKWVPQVLQPTCWQVAPQMLAGVCRGLSPVSGTGDPGTRPWRNTQGGGGAEADSVTGMRGLVLARRLLSLTGSQQDFPEKEAF